MFSTPSDATSGVPEYVAKLKQSLQTAYDHARIAGAEAQRRQKSIYDKRSTQPAFALGDHVFLHHPAVKPGTTPKFHRPWRGPFVIVRRIDDVLVQITNEKGDIQTVHTDRVKHAKSVPAPDRAVPATDVAADPPLSASMEPMIDYCVDTNPQPLPQPAQPAQPVPQVYVLRNRQDIRLPVRYRQP